MMLNGVYFLCYVTSNLACKIEKILFENDRNIKHLFSGHLCPLPLPYPCNYACMCAWVFVWYLLISLYDSTQFVPRICHFVQSVNAACATF